eukprot:947196-Alexandrium_andersonii.AAC.1
MARSMWWFGLLTLAKRPSKLKHIIMQSMVFCLLFTHLLMRIVMQLIGPHLSSFMLYLARIIMLRWSRAGGGDALPRGDPGGALA